MTAKSLNCCAPESDDELLVKLDEVIAEYKDKPGGLIPVLHIAQGIFGFLPEHVLKRISLALDKSYSEVAGVVSFYSYFPSVERGKYPIRICLGTACYVEGAGRVLEAARKNLKVDVGEITEDGLFSLNVARHFGACGLAPIVMIGEETYQRVTPAKIVDILDEYRARDKQQVEGRMIHEGN